MAATAITIAQLFGSESKVNFDSKNPIVDSQEDSFPGLQSSLFVTSLGSRGHRARFSGQLRAGLQASIAAASDALEAIIAVIENHERDKTLLDLFSGDSTALRGTIAGTGVWRGVVEALQHGKKYVPAEAGQFRAFCDFALDFRIIAKV